MYLNLIIGVVIETPEGFFYRLGDKEVYTTSDGYIRFENGVLSYPDNRIKSFIIHSKPIADDNYMAIELKAEHSKVSNFSYVIVHTPTGYIDPATFVKPVTQAEIDNLEQLNYGDPNVVLISETYKPRSFLGENAETIGNSADDGIVTFASSAQPISAGQFGQFPLFAFTKRGISAMEPGETVKFRKIVPFDLNEEIVGKDAVLSAQGILFYLTKRGLKAFIDGRTQNISVDLFNARGASMLASALNDKSCLGYFFDKATGREEIWVGTEHGVFVYSLTYKRWFYLQLSRKLFITLYDRLIGWDGHSLFAEGEGDEVAGEFITAPIHFGSPDLIKRFRKIFYRNSNEAISLPSQTCRQIVIDNDELDEIGDILVEYEIRYPHRIADNAQGGSEELPENTFLGTMVTPPASTI